MPLSVVRLFLLVCLKGSVSCSTQRKDGQHPGSEVTGLRGGDHNSPTRVFESDAHDRRYGHLSYAFNYYGTIAPNRDDFAWVRKMNKVDWMDEEADKKGGAV